MEDVLDLVLQNCIRDQCAVSVIQHLQEQNSSGDSYTSHLLSQSVTSPEPNIARWIVDSEVVTALAALLTPPATIAKGLPAFALLCGQ